MFLLKKLNFLNKNTYLYQLSGQLSSQALGFLLGIFLVRISGVGVSGGYNALLAVINMSVGVVSAGILTNYLRNSIVEDYLLVLVTNIFFTFVVFVLALPVFYLIGYSVVDMFIVYTVSLLMNCIQLSVYSIRLRKLDRKVLLPSVLPLLLVVVNLLFLEPDTLTHFLLIVLACWSVSLLFVWDDLKKIAISKVTFNKIKKYGFASGILVGTTFLTQINGNIDIVLLKKIIDDEAVGFYKIATSLTMFVMPLIGIFSFIYFSEINKYVNDKDFIAFLRRRKQQFLLIGLLTGAFVMFTILFSEMLITFLYKIYTEEVFVATIILSFSVMFNGLAMVNSYTLIGLKNEKEIIIPLFVITILNILSNFLFITYFGIIGAAIAGAVSQLMMFLITNVIVNKVFQKLKNN